MQEQTRKSQVDMKLYVISISNYYDQSQQYQNVPESFATHWTFDNL